MRAHKAHDQVKLKSNKHHSDCEMRCLLNVVKFPQCMVNSCMEDPWGNGGMAGICEWEVTNSVNSMRPLAPKGLSSPPFGASCKFQWLPPSTTFLAKVVQSSRPMFLQNLVWINQSEVLMRCGAYLDCAMVVFLLQFPFLFEFEGHMGGIPLPLLRSAWAHGACCV